MAAADDSRSAIFTDVAGQVGLEFQHYNGDSGELFIPEITGSGGALFDFDRDGDLDLYLVQGAVLLQQSDQKPRLYLDQLYRNDLVVGGEYNGELKLTNVTAESGIQAAGFGMGAAVADYDGDGWLDLYVTNLGPNQMFRNNGDGTFSEVTEKSGTDDPRWSTSAAFLDYDRDGRLDLFVANYVDFSVKTSPNCYAPSSRRDYCGPQAYQPVSDRLFRNRGDGTFEDVTAKAGLLQVYGAGLGVVTADFNLDGWIDIYVANDGLPNQLWTNQGNGTFQDDALFSGVALNRMGVAEAGMGVDAGDFDGDGDEDLFIAHLSTETNTIYVNEGDGIFEDRSVETQLAMPSLPYTGFGTGWFDFDNDGWLDLVVLNGDVRIMEELARQGHPYPLVQPNLLFRNTGKGRFEQITGEAAGVFRVPEVSRGAAFGDIDNDGDTDFAMFNNNGRARLLINNVGNINSWLGLRVRERSGKRDALGARIEIVIDSQRTLWRRVRSDGSYCSANDSRVLVGLGKAKAVQVVRVHWPDGGVEEWTGLAIGRYHVLQQGRGS